MPVKCLSLDADTLRARRSVVDLTQLRSTMRMANASGGGRTNVVTDLFQLQPLPLNVGRQGPSQMFFSAGGNHSASSRSTPALGVGLAPHTALNHWGGALRLHGDGNTILLSM